MEKTRGGNGEMLRTGRGKRQAKSEVGNKTFKKRGTEAGAKTEEAKRRMWWWCKDGKCSYLFVES